MEPEELLQHGKGWVNERPLGESCSPQGHGQDWEWENIPSPMNIPQPLPPHHTSSLRQRAIWTFCRDNTWVWGNLYTPWSPEQISTITIAPVETAAAGPVSSKMAPPPPLARWYTAPASNPAVLLQQELKKSLQPSPPLVARGTVLARAPIPEVSLRCKLSWRVQPPVVPKTDSRVHDPAHPCHCWERIWDIEAWFSEITQTKEKWTKRPRNMEFCKENKSMTHYCPWKRQRRPNNTKNMFQNIIHENFTNLTRKTNIQIQKV